MSTRRTVWAFAAVGLLIPTVMLTVNWFTAWRPPSFWLIWPTWFILLPFSGFYLDFEKAIAIAISSLGNAAVYALIGFVFAKLSEVWRR